MSEDDATSSIVLARPLQLYLVLTIFELLVAINMDAAHVDGYLLHGVQFLSRFVPLIESASAYPEVQAFIAFTALAFWIKVAILVAWLVFFAHENNYANFVVSPLSRKLVSHSSFVTNLEGNISDNVGERGWFRTVFVTVFFIALSVAFVANYFGFMGGEVPRSVVEGKRNASLYAGGLSMWFERTAFGAVYAMALAASVASLIDYFRFALRWIKGGVR